MSANTLQQALSQMVPPGKVRPGKWRGGVIQIWVTRSCDKACVGCTQGSNLGPLPIKGDGMEFPRRAYGYITPDQFEAAVKSLQGYYGVVGVFGGNPAMHPEFETLCEILRANVAWNQRGLWCNNPLGKGKVMRATFNPSHSNLNVHQDRKAYDEFLRDWPECRPCGLDTDSRHSPPYVAIKDVVRKPCTNSQHEAEDAGVMFTFACPDCDGTRQVLDEAEAWNLIANCDINKHWSAMIGVFRGSLRAYFCEIAGAQAMLHQHEPDYPDTGLPLNVPCLSGELPWWKRPMVAFSEQVQKHCMDCGVPLRGHGALANSNGPEQVSATHRDIYTPKKHGRGVQLVTLRTELGAPLGLMTDYIGNAKR